jgi:glycosyltransferase involved in cell wall biosynthesis
MRNRQLSVLMFCPQFRPLVGGAERQAEKLARALARKGVNVTVLTPRLAPETPLHEQDDGVAIHRFALSDICKRFPAMRGLGPINLLLRNCQTRQAASKHLAEHAVLHTHIASPLTVPAMIAAQRRGMPVLCKVAMAGDRNDLRELSRIGLGGTRLVSQLVTRMDHWVATTKAVGDSLSEWAIPRGRLSHIPNGVDVSPYTSGTSSSVARRFLYLGRLSRNIQRDVPTLIRAFDRVASEVPGLELAIVGDGDLYEETAGMTARAANAHRISLPGMQDAKPWLDWADCLVLPSRREGLSNALLEAMAHGLACIANDIPPNREVLEDGESGLLVPVGEEDPLYTAIKRLATHAGAAQNLGAKARRRVEVSYSIDSVADRYIELYEHLLQAARRPGRP